jgi:flagellar basal-body rod protein FlgG
VNYTEKEHDSTMDMAFFAAQTGLIAASENQAAIADNIANSTTPSYKKNRIVQADFELPGTKIIAQDRDFSVGDPRPTGRQLDLFIDGQAFFQIDINGTEGYTRNGSFNIDSEGNLITKQGYAVNPAIVVPDNDLSVRVRPDGTVLAVLDNDGATQNLGQLDAARFPNTEGLVAIGDRLYLEGPKEQYRPPNPFRTAATIPHRRVRLTRL